MVRMSQDSADCLQSQRLPCYFQRAVTPTACLIGLSIQVREMWPNARFAKSSAHETHIPAMKHHSYRKPKYQATHRAPETTEEGSSETTLQTYAQAMKTIDDPFCAEPCVGTMPGRSQQPTASKLDARPSTVSGFALYCSAQSSGGAERVGSNSVVRKGSVSASQHRSIGGRLLGAC